MRSAKIRRELLMAVVVAGLCMASGQSRARTDDYMKYVPEGEWIVRAGAGIGDPGADNKLSDGTKVELLDDTQFVGDLTWKFKPHWGVEFFGSSPFKNEFRARSGGAVLANGSVEYIPWTLSLQYHFLPESPFRPYVGIGPTYGWIMGDEPPDIDFDNDWGFGGGVGVDLGYPESHWIVNAAVKYISIGFEYDGPTGDPYNGDTLDIDPLIYSLSVGYRFWRPQPAPAAAAPVVAAPVAAAAPVDSDGDGVIDADDKCPNTPKGDRVGPHGCSCDVSVQLQFKFDSAELTSEDMATLDRVAMRLNELQFVGGEVAGYTDSTGDEAYNLDLSKRRAQSALDYLASKGVAPGRMTAVGFGEANPIADNATAEGRAQNRRVVIRRTDCGPAK
jgi:outer membrane protein OmpA-like peptidoglycan-associated protein/outer membrane protein W